MDDKSSEINAPINEENVMDVTQTRVATGGNFKIMQLDKETVNKGEYYEKKIKEIDAELMRFELEKDSNSGRVLNKEMDSSLNGETDNCGVLSNQVKHELAACEESNKEKLNHVISDEGNPSAQVTHVPRKKSGSSGKLQLHVEKNSEKGSKNHQYSFSSDSTKMLRC